MKLDTLRSSFLEFYKGKDHVIVPSAPLVPENDPTTLFTSSGMQPMVPYLLGEPHPMGARIADSQKSFRTQDIEEVGDNRHTTFFEMLGNWSLGDYFKNEQLSWVFEWLTKGIGLDPNRLYVTVFGGNKSIDRDTESVKIWKELFSKEGITALDIEDAQEKGMQDGRIFYYTDEKNWWSRSGIPANMPPGEPGGPDSEIFFDFGIERGLHEASIWKDQPCHVNCDCGRFVEICNSVFMQYQKQADGTFAKLPKQNVDFGGGLERILMATENNPDVFRSHAFMPIIKHLEFISKKRYGDDEKITRSFRVIADHVRAGVMLAADGVYPSNKQQGYFARRLLRRSIRYAHMMGIEKPFLADMVKVVVSMYATAYPSLVRQQLRIEGVFVEEEEKFLRTLAKGLKEIDKIVTLDGQRAFRMYETYGFPLELTQEIAIERGQEVNKEQFESEFAKHKELSRTASAGMFKGGLAEHSEGTTKYHTATHLLHAALRKILGNHVGQKGSNITVERLRFDFSHPQALTSDEKKLIEDQINAWIAMDLPVTREEMPKAQALEQGAVAFFVEKYPEFVSVYTIGNDPRTDWVSKELCGGPHVERTGIIGKVKIFKEEAVAAGVRRVYLK